MSHISGRFYISTTPAMSDDSYAAAYIGDREKFEAMTSGHTKTSRQKTKPPKPDRQQRTQTTSQIKQKVVVKTVRPEGAAPLVQIYFRLCLYLAGLICAAIIDVEVELIQGNDNLNGIEACPFGLDKDPKDDTGTQSSCNFVKVASLMAIIVALTFGITLACFAYHKRVKSSTLIIVELISTIVTAIFTLVSSLIIIIGFHSFCDTFSGNGLDCEASTKAEQSSRDGFDSVYDRLSNAYNSACAMLVIWTTLAIMVIWRFRVVRRRQPGTKTVTAKQGGSSQSMQSNPMDQQLLGQ